MAKTRFALKESTAYDLTNAYQNIEIIIYSIISFFIPFFIGHPQIFIGIVVNALLATSAVSMRWNRILPLIVAPSLGVFARGVVFGPFTIFLLYMIPFIWLGNLAFVYIIRLIHIKYGKNYFLGMFSGAIIKAGFLFLVALVFYTFGLVPAIFLIAMGLIQLVTAVCGGVAGYGLHKAKSLLKN